ncbi:hypothetical protein EON65_30225 [archaeon]|nr:MAG: hypothetical protein EON65_30225 [archaeon]
MNDFLIQWVNKIKYDRFVRAVDQTFEHSQNPANIWTGLKEEIYNSMRSWYRTTHAISPQASAQEMAGIMEAYWNLSAKRFIDNCCMHCDKLILTDLPEQIQDQMYQFIRDDTKLQGFFAENPEVARRKQELESRRSRLMEASAKLASVTPAVLPK